MTEFRCGQWGLYFVICWMLIGCQPLPQPNANLLQSESALAELMWRNHAYPNEEGTAYIDPAILIGTLPENLPFRLTWPESTQVIGSIMNQEQESGNVYATILLAATDFLPLWKSELLSQGYRLPAYNSIADKYFRPTPAPNKDGLMVCNDELGAIIWVNTFAPQAAITDVRFQIEVFESYGSGPCGSFDEPSAMFEPEPAIVSLDSPVGVRHLAEQRNGTAAEFSAELEARTELSADELIAFYDQQLIKLGWTATAQGTADIAAWSIWSGEDEEGNSWVLNLLVLEKPLVPQYKKVTLEGTQVR